jgi:hypothetical protein
MEFYTLKDLDEMYRDEILLSKTSHKKDGLCFPKDMTVYVDAYRKQVKKHLGSDFSDNRMHPEQMAVAVSKKIGKVFQATKIYKDGHHATVFLKEVRAK